MPVELHDFGPTFDSPSEVAEGLAVLPPNCFNPNSSR
jgi:hypothetical protein